MNERTKAVVKFLRAGHKGDGAVEESVQLVCNELEQALAELELRRELAHDGRALRLACNLISDLVYATYVGESTHARFIEHGFEHIIGTLYDMNSVGDRAVSLAKFFRKTAIEEAVVEASQVDANLPSDK